MIFPSLNALIMHQIDGRAVDMWIKKRFYPHIHSPYYYYFIEISPSKGTSLLCGKGDISTLG